MGDTARRLPLSRIEMVMVVANIHRFENDIWLRKKEEIPNDASGEHDLGQRKKGKLKKSKKSDCECVAMTG